jgi:hypothetical protein
VGAVDARVGRAQRWLFGLVGPLALALMAVTGTLGCRGCGTPAGVVARLAELHGTALRSAGVKSDAWSSAGAGATFVVGDAVRTGAAASAKVELLSGGGLKLGENTLVRFLAQGAGPGSRSVGVETGEAEVETGSDSLAIETPFGAARLEPGSRVRVAASTDDSRFEVVVGRAEIERDGGEATKLEASQRFVVTAGRAVVESLEPREPPEAGVGVAAASPADASAEAGASLAVEADVRGSGVRSAAPGKGPLVPLGEGHVEMAEGSRIVVPEGATVAVTRGGERAVVVGQADVVVGRAGGPLLENRGGRVIVSSPTPGTRIDVPGGSIVLAAAGAGSRQAQVTVDRQAAQVIAEAGRVDLQGHLSTASLGAGQSGTLDRKGVAQVEASAPTAADVTLPSGESCVIHSPRGSAAVRIRLDGVCPGDALLEVVSGGARRTVFVRGDGPGAAVVSLGPGAHGDRVRCVDADGRPGEARPGGTIQVLRDSGVQMVPRTAPRNVVDADGRHYSVLYQNLLPLITARWPRAPVDRATSLHLEPSKGAGQVLHAAAGSPSASPAALAEGEYRFWFEVDGDAATRSPETTLRIAFDNAAPAAQVQLPVEGQTAGDVVHVAGIAIEGASVSVGGVPIPLDAAYRFTADVPARPGDPKDRSVAVRIAHPTHGVHYYLRTLGGA